MKTKTTMIHSFFLATLLAIGVLTSKPSFADNNGGTLTIDRRAGQVITHPENGITQITANVSKDQLVTLTYLAQEISWVGTLDVEIIYENGGLEVCHGGVCQMAPSPTAPNGSQGANNGPEGNDGFQPNHEAGPPDQREKGDKSSGGAPSGHVTGQVTGLDPDQSFHEDGGQPDSGQQDQSAPQPTDCAPNCGGTTLPNPDGDNDGGPLKKQGYAAQPTDEGTGPTGPAAKQSFVAQPTDEGTGPTGPAARQGLAAQPTDEGTGPTNPLSRVGLSSVRGVFNLAH